MQANNTDTFSLISTIYRVVPLTGSLQNFQGWLREAVSGLHGTISRIKPGVER